MCMWKSFCYSLDKYIDIFKLLLYWKFEEVVNKMNIGIFFMVL